jgi:hypothetical protein
MNTSIQLQLQVKLNVPATVIQYFETMEQWENEGGRPVPAHEYINLPLKPGEVFKVQSGRMIFEDKHVYYLANIEKIPPDKDKPVTPSLSGDKA